MTIRSVLKLPKIALAPLISIQLISIYSLSNLCVLSNLIGSLSRSNLALFTPYGVRRKQNGRRKLVSISESEILRIQDDAVLQNTKRVTKFSLKVFKGKRRAHAFANQCLTSF